MSVAAAGPLVEGAGVLRREPFDARREVSRRAIFHLIGHEHAGSEQVLADAAHALRAADEEASGGMDEPVGPRGAGREDAGAGEADHPAARARGEHEAGFEFPEEGGLRHDPRVPVMRSRHLVGDFPLRRQIVAAGGAERVVRLVVDPGERQGRQPARPRHGDDVFGLAEAEVDAEEDVRGLLAEAGEARRVGEGGGRPAPESAREADFRAEALLDEDIGNRLPLEEDPRAEAVLGRKGDGEEKFRLEQIIQRPEGGAGAHLRAGEGSIQLIREDVPELAGDLQPPGRAEEVAVREPRLGPETLVGTPSDAEPGGPRRGRRDLDDKIQGRIGGGDPGRRRFPADRGEADGVEAEEVPLPFQLGLLVVVVARAEGEEVSDHFLADRLAALDPDLSQAIAGAGVDSERHLRGPVPPAVEVFQSQGVDVTLTPQRTDEAVHAGLEPLAIEGIADAETHEGRSLLRAEGFGQPLDGELVDEGGRTFLDDERDAGVDAVRADDVVDVRLEVAAVVVVQAEPVGVDRDLQRVEIGAAVREAPVRRQTEGGQQEARAFGAAGADDRAQLPVRERRVAAEVEGSHLGAARSRLARCLPEERGRPRKRRRPGERRRSGEGDGQRQPGQSHAFHTAASPARRRSLRTSAMPAANIRTEIT